MVGYAFWEIRYYGWLQALEDGLDYFLISVWFVYNHCFTPSLLLGEASVYRSYSLECSVAMLM
jgi:hypothetical protein